MTKTSPALPWVLSTSTVLNGSQISPNRYQLLHYQLRLLPVSLVSSFSAFPALPSSSLDSLRVQSLLQHPFDPRSQSRRSLSGYPPLPPQAQLRSSNRTSGKLLAVSASSSASRSAPATDSEEVFFDGGVHVGDLVVNLVFGLTLVWLPLTLTAVFRGLFLRYRLTNVRVTVQSGLLGGDRKDFLYDVVKGVKAVPRFIGEWGDVAIELKDGTSVDIRCVPKFREIASYIEQRAAGRQKLGNNSSELSSSSPGRTSTGKKGFS